MKAIGQRLFVSLAILVQGGKEMGVKGIIVNIKKPMGFLEVGKIKNERKEKTMHFFQRGKIKSFDPKITDVFHI